MQATDALTEAQWQTADAIAQSLVKRDTDVNEVGKVIAYLRAHVQAPDIGDRLFTYLNTLARYGRQIGHSQKTSDYYADMAAVCTEYLKPFQQDGITMLQILGWTMRLMRYYVTEPIGELAPPPASSIKPTKAISVTQQYAIGQVISATVTAKKGNKITYTLENGQPLTVKEPKAADSLQEQQQVEVQVTNLKEDGTIKSVKKV